MFPPWLLGSWTCSSRTLGVAAPLGQRLAPRRALAQPVGDASLLTFTSNWVQEDGIGCVADVAANFRALSEAQLGRVGCVEAVVIQGSHLSALFSPGSIPADLFLSAQRSDSLSSSESAQQFHTAECTRYVTGSSASDSQVLSRFRLEEPGRVRLLQRIGVFLSPMDALYFECVGQAVALVEVETVMVRSAESLV